MTATTHGNRALPLGGRWNASEPAGQTAGRQGDVPPGVFFWIVSRLRHALTKSRAAPPDAGPAQAQPRQPLRRLPDQEFQVTIKRPSGDITTQTVLINGAQLQADLPILARLALASQHDIETARILRITLITPDAFAA